MREVVFVTGNQAKADYLSRYLGFEVDHEKVDLDEIQSLDLQVIVEHKVRQAYEVLQRPVLVEDVSLEFVALGRLPGPLVKWFIEEIGLEEVCRLVDGKSRDAIAKCVFGFYDGKEVVMFEGEMAGRVAEHPIEGSGYGWDPIFIPEGYEVTRGELDEEGDRETYLQIKPFVKVKEFLENLV